MAYNDALKILKRLNKSCPECDAKKGLVLILRSKNNNGVIYYEKYIFCQICEFEEIFEEKNKNRYDEVVEEEDDYEHHKRRDVGIYSYSINGRNSR